MKDSFGEWVVFHIIDSQKLYLGYQGQWDWRINTARRFHSKEAAQSVSSRMILGENEIILCQVERI